MNTKIPELLCCFLLLTYVFAQRISELRCDETSLLRTDPRSLYPYLMEIVEISPESQISSRCYGVLLSENYVLSSYACLIAPSTVRIRVRKLKIDGEQYSNRNHFTIKSTSRIVANPMSLIELNKPISYSNRLSIFRPACLWTKDVLPSEPTYLIYGNERDNPEEIISSSVRIKTGNIISDDYCIEHLPEDFDIDFDKICMNTTSRLKFYAAGSPIEAKVGNQNYIIGMVHQSFYENRDSIHLGSLTSSYITWIENTVWPNETASGTQFNCGKRKILHKPLMAYSQPTYHGEYPWHVALYKVQGGRQHSYEYICGGSIIDYQIIVTAAHCVHDERGILPPNRLLIVAGTHNLNVYQTGTKTYIVNNITVHEDYNLEYLENDIALLKLSSSIKYSNYIRPICITNYLHFENMTEGIVAGWGINELHQPSDILLQATLPIRTNIECRQSNRPVFNTYLNDNNYCAGSGNGTSVCSGDSGGGMIFEDNSQWYLRGIVSLGVALPMSNRCDITQMVLFTDVSKYYNWITRHLGK